MEVLADGIPVVLGSWSISDEGSSSSIVSKSFSQRGGGGFAARASWALHPRWTVGGYLGYGRMSNGQIDLDQAGQGGSWPLRLRMVRTGAVGTYRWPVHRALTCGIGIEGGFIVGTTGAGDTPFGAELAPDFFLDIPLGAAPPRPYLTFSFGFRAGLMDHRLIWSGYGSYARETWIYFMPVVRAGLGVGR